MRRVQTLRDLLPGEAHPNESSQMIRRVVDRWRTEASKERIVVPGPLADWTSRLPGDTADHPLHGRAQNPYPGVNVVELSRMYREGRIPLNLERQALAYIKQYEALERFGEEVPLGGARPFKAPPKPPEGPQPNWPGYHRG